MSDQWPTVAATHQRTATKGLPMDLPEVIPLPTHEPDKDWLLTFLVGLANDAGIGVDITVVADGTVVSGRLVSMHDWLRMNADQFPDGEVAQILADHLRQLAAEATPTSADSDDDDGQPSASYIHLADARYVDAQGAYPGRGSLLWRGRLSGISGWSLGSLRAEETP